MNIKTLALMALFLSSVPVWGAEVENGTEAVAEVLYRHPTKRAKDYNKFYIEPVVIRLSEKDTTLTPVDIKTVSAAFTDAARNSFLNNKKGLTLVEKPEPGVLILQSEVSELEPVKPELTGQGDVALRFDGSGRGGILLLTAVDGATGEKVVVLRDQLKGPKYLVGDEKKRLMNMLEAFRIWGSLLQMRLQELKKQPPSNPKP